MNWTRIAISALALLIVVAALSGVGARHKPASGDDVCMALSDRPPSSGAEAIATLQRCHVEHPTDAQIAVDLGDAYTRVGDDRKAERAYADALAADARDGDVQLRLARLLLRRGATTDARQHLEAALRVQPNRRVLLDLLASTSVE